MRTFFVHTFGCQMNVHDSARIEDVLAGAGLTPAAGIEGADVVVINTCSVREKAEHKLMSLLGTLRGLTAARPGARLVVAGCVAQQLGERLARQMPHVDIVIGPDNIPELPRLLSASRTGAALQVRTAHDLDAPQFLPARPHGQGRISDFVTIMKGCDERCTYCIVPHTRGSERYRPGADVVAEVSGLVEAGVREVTLLGQTVNSWVEPGPARPTVSQFAGLLRRIAGEVPDLLRLRYASPHPRHVVPDLVAAHAELDVLAAHVHLPAQSGSDRVLKRMVRRHTRAELVACARSLADARTGLTLSTDLIVGFPGETEADFLDTLSLVREVGFVAAFAFKYSPRPHTPALSLGDDVAPEVKDERLARLFEVVAEQQRAHLASLVGTFQSVLGEAQDPEGLGSFAGRTERNEIVHFTAPPGVDPVGKLVPVMVERANRHSLLGRMDGARSRLGPEFRRNASLPVAGPEVPV